MIQMKSGVYGGKNKMIRPEDGPFSLTPEEEARLVNRGVAKYVGDTPGITDMDSTPVVHEGMTAKQLREIGKEYGLTFKIGMTKAEMVTAILDSMPDEDAQADEDEGDTSDREDAPTFNAAEAVQ